ncbi:MAG: hypothetical protein R3194_09125 [Limnobacter sp.]|nr:hypothetical protein [Limnobacter sp.]
MPNQISGPVGVTGRPLVESFAAHQDLNVEHNSRANQPRSALSKAALLFGKAMGGSGACGCARDAARAAQQPNNGAGREAGRALRQLLPAQNQERGGAVTQRAAGNAMPVSEIQARLDAAGVSRSIRR